jgi:hypothetical protein
MKGDKKILVIGSLGHSLADRCISWDEIKSDPEVVYLGDYHLLIINLQSLEETKLDKRMKEVFEKMRKEINEIIWGNTEIICITAPTVKKWLTNIKRKSTSIPEISNYHWCPIYMDFVKREGSSFENKNEDGYFKFVKRWTHFLNDHNTDLYEIYGEKDDFEIHWTIWLQNLAKKELAFTINIVEFNVVKKISGSEKRDNLAYSKSISFLPPPTEISVEEGINFLLEKEKGITRKTELPKWAENIWLPGEEELLKKIRENEELKKKCEEEIKENKSKLSELVKFKNLLTTDAEELENIVEETFKFLDIKVQKGPKGKEDKIIVDPETKSEIPVEITGVKNSIPETKLNQLIGRLVDEERVKKIKCKNHGVLIGNHYKEMPLKNDLEGRKKPFERDLIEKAIKSKIGLVSTIELFKAVRAKLKGEDENVKNFINSLFNKSGEVKFNQ